MSFGLDQAKTIEGKNISMEKSEKIFMWVMTAVLLLMILVFIIVFLSAIWGGINYLRADRPVLNKPHEVQLSVESMLKRGVEPELPAPSQERGYYDDGGFLIAIKGLVEAPPPRLETKASFLKTSSLAGSQICNYPGVWKFIEDPVSNTVPPSTALIDVQNLGSTNIKEIVWNLWGSMSPQGCNQVTLHRWIGALVAFLDEPPQWSLDYVKEHTIRALALTTHDYEFVQKYAFQLASYMWDLQCSIVPFTDHTKRIYLVSPVHTGRDSLISNFKLRQFRSNAIVRLIGDFVFLKCDDLYIIPEIGYPVVPVAWSSPPLGLPALY